MRIEEVSKNHQNRAFCFRISPDIDISPTSADVSQVVSGPVQVFSKSKRSSLFVCLMFIGFILFLETESYDEKPPKVRPPQIPDEEIHNPLYLHSLFEEGKCTFFFFVPLYAHHCVFVASQALSEWCDLVIDILKDVRAKLVYKDTLTCFYRCSGCSVYSNTQEFQHSENCSVTFPHLFSHFEY